MQFKDTCYSGDLGCGEDRESIKRHLERLCEEHSRACPDMESVHTLMNITYLARREEIVRDSPHVAAVLKKYPFLGNFDEVRVAKDYIQILHACYVCINMYVCPQFMAEFHRIVKKKIAQEEIQQIMLKVIEEGKKNTLFKLEKIKDGNEGMHENIGYTYVHNYNQ